MEFLIFIIGLFVGSFLLVLIDRLPKSEPVVNSRSKCDFCGHILSVLDLVPVLSYVYLQGRCRYCKKKLSVSYPAFEFFTAFSFTVLYILSSSNLISYPMIQGSSLFLFLFLAVIFSVLTVIFFIDLATYLIPLVLMIFGSAVTSVYLFFSSFELFLFHVLVGGATAGFFFLIYFITFKKGIGLGDVIYGFLMGLILGFPQIIVGLYTAFLTGAIVSIILVLLGKKKLKGGVVPFGPFLVFGTVFALVSGGAVWSFVNAFLGL